SFAELDLHRAHHEGKARRLLLGLLEQSTLIGAEKPQIVGASALHETQIACVIHEAREVSVLVVDAHRHHVAAVTNFAVEADHRQGTCCCIAASQLRPSNSLSLIAFKSMPSRQRTLTSILSGSERGT